MNRRLNLYKDKLPKRKRKVNDDDVYIRGMYNPFLDTKGYEVEDLRDNIKTTTAEKGVLADYPDFEGIGWIFDSEVKDYETLLKDRRNKMTQTFRYMLKQNSISSSSKPSCKPPSSNNSSSQMSDVRDTRHPNLTSSESERESVINKSNSSIVSRRESDDALVSPQSSEKRSEASNSPESVASTKKSTPQPSLQPSSSSSSRSNNLPIESSQSENISVRSSLAPTIQHISSQSSAQTIHSRPSTIQYISD